MPTKRRKAKVRQLDELDVDELMYGPGACLLNGCGYMPANQLWRDIPESERAAILSEMRADWQRHHATVWQHWNARDQHALWCAKEQHGDPAEPWAEREFGAIQ